MPAMIGSGDSRSIQAAAAIVSPQLFSFQFLGVTALELAPDLIRFVL